MGPDLPQLEAFLAVAELLHFGRAGERLHLSQSAVSHRIKALEESVGVALFDRSARAVRLTPAGRAFRRRAIAGHQELLRAADDAREAAAGARGRLVVGCAGALSPTPLVGALATLRADAPALDLEIVQQGTRQQHAALLDGRVDVACTFRRLPEHDALARLVSPAVPLVAAVPSAHPAAEAGPLELGAPLPLPIVLLSEQIEAGFRGFSQDHLGDQEQVPITVDTLDAALVFVQAGIAMVVMPPTSLLPPGVTLVPTVPALHARFIVTWRADRDNPAVDALVALLQESWVTR